MHFKVNNRALWPMTKEAADLMQKFSDGDEVDVEVLNPINTKFNAKMFAAIGALAKASDISIKAMQARLLIATGRFDNVKLAPHKTIPVPHSMSRNAMSMRQREEFWDDLREFAERGILPTLDVHVADGIRLLFYDQVPERVE